MFRSAPGRLTGPWLAHFGPSLLALGFAAGVVGCSDTPPGAAEIDPSALKKAVAERRSIKFSKPGRKTGNVATTQLRAKGKSSLPLEPSVKTPVKTR